MRVLFLYLPLPIFWALFDQQGSRWTLQATRMDGNLFGVYTIKPDQIQVFNPLLIIAMIPIFEYGVYPLMAKFNFLIKPLQRITTGGLLAAAAFIICGFLQLKIEADLPILPESGSAYINVVNSLPCNLMISNNKLFDGGKSIPSFGIYEVNNVPLDVPKQLDISSATPNDVTNNCSITSSSLKFDIRDEQLSILFIYQNNPNGTLSIKNFTNKDMLKTPEEGGAYVRILFNIPTLDFNFENQTFLLKNDEFTYELAPSNDSSIAFGIGQTDLKEVDIVKGGKYRLFLPGRSGGHQNTPLIDSLDFKQGGSYLVIVSTDNEVIFKSILKFVHKK